MPVRAFSLQNGDRQSKAADAGHRLGDLRRLVGLD